MVKKQYVSVSDSERQRLISLIYEEGLCIRQAAIQVKIYYPTAKAINKTYLAERRVNRKKHRFRRVASSDMTSQPTSTNAKKMIRTQKNQKSNSSIDDQMVTEGQKITTLQPIRQELGLGTDIYESLDEAQMIDVSQDRIDEVRQQNMPIDHFLQSFCHSKTQIAKMAEINQKITIMQVPVKIKSKKVKVRPLDLKQDLFFGAIDQSISTLSPSPNPAIPINMQTIRNNWQVKLPKFKVFFQPIISHLQSTIVDRIGEPDLKDIISRNLHDPNNTPPQQKLHTTDRKS